MSASTQPLVNSTHPALNSQNSNNYNFTVGQIVDAKVVNFDKQELQDGKKTKQRIIITYEIQGSDCPSKEEVNKQDGNLSLGDIVKVKN